jgi:hypothetical protein
MSTVRDRPPEGRYGRVGDTAVDRRLKRLGAVLGSLAALGIGLGGWWYLSSHAVSGQVVAFQVVSDSEVRVHLEVDKDAGQVAVCTLRSQAADQSEVGRRDVTIAQHASQVDTVLTIRTAGRGTTAELIDCKAADQR